MTKQRERKVENIIDIPRILKFISQFEKLNMFLSKSQNKIIMAVIKDE